MPHFTLDLKHHSAGDYSLILSEYSSGSKGIFLTQPFANAQEVHDEFAKLEALIAKAKAKALRAMDGIEKAV